MARYNSSNRYPTVSLLLILLLQLLLLEITPNRLLRCFNEGTATSFCLLVLPPQMFPETPNIDPIDYNPYYKDPQKVPVILGGNPQMLLTVNAKARSLLLPTVCLGVDNARRCKP